MAQSSRHIKLTVTMGQGPRHRSRGRCQLHCQLTAELQALRPLEPSLPGCMAGHRGWPSSITDEAQWGEDTDPSAVEPSCPQK